MMTQSTAQAPDTFDETSEYLDELRNDHLGLVGSSPAMVALRDLIRRVAPSERPVLIAGAGAAGWLVPQTKSGQRIFFGLHPLVAATATKATAPSLAMRGARRWKMSPASQLRPSQNT